MKINTIILGVLFSVPTLCLSAQPISVDDLVANRSKYHKQNVAVVGRFYLAFEMNGLYGKEHSIWINEGRLPKSLKNQIAKDQLQDKTVLLKAKFFKERDGHLLGTPGKFAKIYSIEIYDQAPL